MTYAALLARGRVAGSKLRRDHGGRYYFEYGSLGRCYPTDNSHDIGDDEPATRKVDEIKCYPGNPFSVSAVSQALGPLFLQTPNPDERSQDQAYIPKGDWAYGIGVQRTPSGVAVELVASGPKTLLDSLYQGRSGRTLTGPFLRGDGPKMLVREVRLRLL